MTKQFLRITNLIHSDLSVVRLDEGAFRSHVDENYRDDDAEELRTFLDEACIGDDIYANRWNGKPSVVVRTR